MRKVKLINQDGKFWFHEFIVSGVGQLDAIVEDSEGYVFTVSLDQFYFCDSDTYPFKND